MTKPGDSLTIKKTIHELAKEFPNKTYIELEKYRDADRNEEAQRIITQQENEELKEDQLTESQQKQEELEPIERENWEEKYKKEYKNNQELQNNLNRLGKENNDLYKRIAKLKEAELAAHSVQKARESGL
jgi:GTP-dependent phosphoenolpyruvate carboxykinase